MIAELVNAFPAWFVPFPAEPHPDENVGDGGLIWFALPDVR
ncbi:hypothetical protein JBW_04697 [Pelosinus fermentans JBW45]|uniref:Uncharacterized protein n=1 Tax=Pelosinus fermentans JBW45 TaxID=1192197 RepID=I9NU18_9FIRM|nr:hypothetical protein JBW_04697 [Pelosinus fermentans JBW45]